MTRRQNGTQETTTEPKCEQFRGFYCKQKEDRETELHAIRRQEPQFTEILSIVYDFSCRSRYAPFKIPKRQFVLIHVILISFFKHC